MHTRKLICKTYYDINGDVAQTSGWSIFFVNFCPTWPVTTASYLAELFQTERPRAPYYGDYTPMIIFCCCNGYVAVLLESPSALPKHS